MKKYPLAVLISDIHFTIPTLELASTSLRAAIEAARQYNVPLIVCGDTLDTKAVIRGEIVNELLSILGDSQDIQIDFIAGNHDQFHAASNENSLRFMNGYTERTSVISTESVVRIKDHYLYLLAYNTPEIIRQRLVGIPTGSIVIMHQGLVGAEAGHYIQDPTALNPEDVADYRVISGHYHQRQDIKCGRPRRGAVGLFSYVGNPYTLTFAEANQQKGFQILMSDGLLEFRPLDLRRHIILTLNESGLDMNSQTLCQGDLIWIKASGSRAFLKDLTKEVISEKFFSGGGDTNFKLTKTLVETEVKADTPKSAYSDADVFDNVIDSQLSDDKGLAARLKELWRKTL